MSHYICNHLSLSGRLLFSLRWEQVGLVCSRRLNAMREPAMGARMCPRQMPTAVPLHVLALVGWRRPALPRFSRLRNLQVNLLPHRMAGQKGSRVKKFRQGKSFLQGKPLLQRTVLRQGTALLRGLLRNGIFCGTRNFTFLPLLAVREW